MSNPFKSAIAPRGKWLKFNQEVGQSHTIQITAPVTERQATEYVPGGGRGEPKVTKDGRPVMEQLIEGLDYNAESEDEAQAILLISKYAQRAAIGRALEAAKADNLEVGGVLTLTWTGYGQGKPGLNPPKSFEAEYTAPEPSGEEWGDDE